MSEAYRLGYNYGVAIHPEIDSFQGETRLPRELTGNSESVYMNMHVHAFEGSFGRLLGS